MRPGFTISYSTTEGALLLLRVSALRPTLTVLPATFALGEGGDGLRLEAVLSEPDLLLVRRISFS